MSKLDEILDNYWDDIVKDEVLITTIQAKHRQELKDLFFDIISTTGSIVKDGKTYISYDRLMDRIEKL